MLQNMNVFVTRKTQTENFKNTIMLNTFESKVNAKTVRHHKNEVVTSQNVTVHTKLIFQK